LTLEALVGEARDLQILLDQDSRYHFLGQLQPVTNRITSLTEKDYAYVLNHLSEFSDELLTTKEDLIGPVKTFMRGAQRKTYDEALAFYREKEANFSEIPDEELAPLRQLAESVTPFQCNVLPQAKAAVAKLRSLIDSRLSAEREAGLAIIDTHEARLVALPEFGLFSETQRGQVLQKSNDARQALKSARFIIAIRDRLNRYTAQDYPAQLALANRLGTPTTTDGSGDAGKGKVPRVEPQYIAASSLRADCGLPYIATVEDLDRWLKALRAVAIAELEKKNRISL
jgi:hypothetical protein